MEERVHVPQWKHYPLLGWFHYRNNVTRRFLRQPNSPILPRVNPYVGFFNHAMSVQVSPTMCTVGTQTDRDPALELGLQIIRRNNL